jgi:ferritin-like metal-binding protein YciE
LFKKEKTIHNNSRRDKMTEKELLYVEDAINHEKNMVDILNDKIDNLEDNQLLDYINQEIKDHKKQQKELEKLLEDCANE